MSNIPAAPPVEHYHAWILGKPFGAAAASAPAEEKAPKDTLNLPEMNLESVLEETFHSHASFDASDGEIDFNPPDAGMSKAPVEKPVAEMTMAE